MTNSADPDQLVSLCEKPTDLELHSLQMEGISGSTGPGLQTVKIFCLLWYPIFFFHFRQHYGENFTQYGPNKRNCKRKQICTRWLCEAEVVTPFQNIKKRYFSYLKKSSVNKVAFFLNLFNPEFLKWTRPCLNLVRTIVSNRGLGLIGIYTVCKFFRAEMVNTCMYYEWKPLWWAKMEKQEDRKRGLS